MAKSPICRVDGAGREGNIWDRASGLHFREGDGVRVLFVRHTALHVRIQGRPRGCLREVTGRRPIRMSVTGW